MSQQVDSLSSKMDKVLRMIPRGTFGAIGGALGGPTGAVIGQGISMITGYGKYKIQENSIAKMSGNSDDFAKMGIPLTVPGFASGAVRIQHREYLGDVVYTGENFKNTVFRFNPGNSVTFPWMNAVGNSFQQWLPKGMVVYFESLCSDYTAQLGLGQVVVASNYNVNDPPYADLIEMKNSQYAVSGKPSLSMIHCVECAPMQMAYKRYYTARDKDAVTPTADFCTIQVGVAGLPSGVPVGTALGSLWVSYDLELTKPIMNVVANNVMDVLWYTTTTSTGLLFGNDSLSNTQVINPTYAVGSQRVDYALTSLSPSTLISITQRSISSNPASAIRFYRGGVWRIQYETTGTGFAGGINVTTNLGPISCVNTYFTPGVVTAAACYLIWTVTVPSGVSIANYAELDVDWVTAPTTVSSFQLRISYLGT